MIFRNDAALRKRQLDNLMPLQNTHHGTRSGTNSFKTFELRAKYDCTFTYTKVHMREADTEGEGGEKLEENCNINQHKSRRGEKMQRTSEVNVT